jgi:hypothetical protein
MRRRGRSVQLLLASVSALTLTLGGAAVEEQGGPLPQRPARDTSAAGREQTGTAGVAGRIVSAATNRAVRGARVVLSLPGGVSRSAVTSESGRYEITALPAGAAMVTASKEGYVAMSYGQRTYPGIGSPLKLAEGERVEEVDISLPRGGVVTGCVFDESGEPLVGAAVRAARVEWVSGERRVAASGADSTDDRGQYRVYGLRPGTYYVSATAKNEATEPLSQATGRGYAPTYYPAAVDHHDATAVRVNAGDEVAGIDVMVQRTRVAEVSGTVVSSESAARASFFLLPGTGDALMGAFPGTPVLQDGTFRVRHVPPGRYVALARGVVGNRSPGASGRPGSTVLYAAQSVAVNGENVTGMTMALRPGGTISGTIAFEATNLRPPVHLSSFRVMAAPVRAFMGIESSVSTVRPDGTFVIGNIPPMPVMLDAVIPTRVAETSVRAPWWLKGIYLNGRDITDTTVEVPSSQPLTGVVVVFSDTVGELSGTVSADDGTRVAHCAVLVFSSDSARWRLPRSRYLQMVRTDMDGRFQVRGLPGGRYHLHAFENIDPLEWSNPDILEKLRDAASLVTLAENETRAIDVRLR